MWNLFGIWAWGIYKIQFFLKKDSITVSDVPH